MKKFILEYGLLVVAIIALLCFFGLLYVLLSNKVSDKKSIYGITDTQLQDSSDLYTDDFSQSIVGDIVETSTAPYFKILDNADFNISTNQIDWDRLFQDVKIMYNNQDITNIDSINGQSVVSTVLVYEYKPSIIPPSGNDINGYAETEEVDAVDKYGHYIYKDASGHYNTDSDYDESTGQRVTITQPKFLISNASVLSKSDYIDCSATSDIDNARQYKVTYRVQVGELKAECTVKYVKNRPGSNIDISGKSKLTFDYS